MVEQPLLGERRHVCAKCYAEHCELDSVQDEDPDGDPFGFALDEHPPGMTIDPASGESTLIDSAGIATLIEAVHSTSAA